jgi:hypothetical protein
VFCITDVLGGSDTLLNNQTMLHKIIIAINQNNTHLPIFFPEIFFFTGGFSVVCSVMIIDGK